jgi:hypothetical protein
MLVYISVNHSWQTDILQVTVHRVQMIERLSCLFLNAMFDALRITYFAYFHSQINYGIIFWESSTNICTVFLLQKRIIRIMMGVEPRYLCKGLFRKLDKLPVTCLCIFSVMMFVVNNRENFQSSLLLYGINMRHKNQLHRPTANLTCTRKGVTYSCVRIFNSLPSNILKLQNGKSVLRWHCKGIILPILLILWINFFLILTTSPIQFNYKLIYIYILMCDNFTLYMTLECIIIVAVFLLYLIVYFVFFCIYLLCLLSLHVYVLSDKDMDLFHIQQFNDRYWMWEMFM